MILMTLTDLHYINPQAVAYLSFRPKEPTRSACMLIAFTNDLIPLKLEGDQAEEAILNWRKQCALKRGGRQ